jgi:hypothetical protein
MRRMPAEARAQFTAETARQMQLIQQHRARWAWAAAAQRWLRDRSGKPPVV